MARRNSRARRDARYNAAIRRQLGFLAGKGAALTDWGWPYQYAPIEAFLRPGDSPDRHARPCEPCGGTGDERWPDTSFTGPSTEARAWVWSGKPCPDCNGSGVAV